MALAGRPPSLRKGEGNLIIKFRHVTKSGRKPWEKASIQYGEGKDEHVAVCNLYAFSLYEKAFADSPSSKHHALVDDVTDVEDTGGTLGVLNINWDADSRALWAMLRAGDEMGLNKEVEPVALNHEEWFDAHKADDIDIFHLHQLLQKEIDATFPTALPYYAGLAAQLDRIERVTADAHKDVATGD